MANEAYSKYMHSPTLKAYTINFRDIYASYLCLVHTYIDYCILPLGVALRYFSSQITIV